MSNPVRLLLLCGVIIGLYVAYTGSQEKKSEIAVPDASIEQDESPAIPADPRTRKTPTNSDLPRETSQNVTSTGIPECDAYLAMYFCTMRRQMEMSDTQFLELVNQHTQQWVSGLESNNRMEAKLQCNMAHSVMQKELGKDPEHAKCMSITNIKQLLTNGDTTQDKTSFANPPTTPSTNSSRLAGDFVLEDPLSHETAVEAVKRLGPERGAITLTGFSPIGIRGLQPDGNNASSTLGIGLVARSETLVKAMEQLQAEQVGLEIVVNLSSDVLFDFDKADIKAEAEKELAALAVIIQEKAQGSITVTGHTDSVGSETYNNRLSLERAGSVKQWLVNHAQLPAEKIITEGAGESQPVAANTMPDGSDNPEGRQKNRRVHIVIETMKPTN